MTDRPIVTNPGAGMMTDYGQEPDPRVSTWGEWARVSRDQYNHYMNLPLDAADIAHRHHAIATANLVPHLVAQLEYSWQQIEVWVKWWRDEHRADYGDEAVAKRAIDSMFDDLRDHLVAGVPLHQECRPNREEGRWTP
jgi:hypothetical protein